MLSSPSKLNIGMIQSNLKLGYKILNLVERYQLNWLPIHFDLSSKYYKAVRLKITNHLGIGNQLHFLKFEVMFKVQQHFLL